MSGLRFVCVVAFVLPVFAADPPTPAPKKSTVKTLFGLHTPTGWMLDIGDDGSAYLVFGAGGGLDSLPIPAGTFKPDEVRKALDGLNYDPKGSIGTHFAVHYEEERKGRDGPKARYTTDETVIVPLFEKADEAFKLKYKGLKPGALLRERPGFGLKKK